MLAHGSILFLCRYATSISTGRYRRDLQKCMEKPGLLISMRRPILRSPCPETLLTKAGTPANAVKEAAKLFTSDQERNRGDCEVGYLQMAKAFGPSRLAVLDPADMTSKPNKRSYDHSPNAVFANTCFPQQHHAPLFHCPREEQHVFHH